MPDTSIQPQEEINMRDYVRVLFRQKSVILTSIITVTLVIFLGLQLKTPVYESDVKILVSGQKHTEGPYYRELTEYGGQTQESITQSEIVTSDPILQRAVDALHLDQRPVDYEKKYASPLKRALLAFLAQRHQAKMERTNPEEQKIFNYRNAIEALRKNIKVEPVRDTNIFVIKVTDFDRLGAAVIANVVSRSYVIFDLEQQLAELSLKYGPKHPLVEQLQNNIKQMIDNLSGRPLSNEDAIGTASVKIIQQATIPLKPSGHSKKLVMFIGIFMSVFWGVMLAFIFEYADPTFKTPQEAEKELGLPLLGSIPLVKKIAHHFYQILADQIYLLVKERKLKTLMLTSSGKEENTEDVIINLGRMLSKRGGHKVLVIDANFRNSTLNKSVKFENAKGFAQILEGKCNLKDAAVILSEAKDPKATNKGIHLIPAGTTDLNPVILLDSAKVKEVLSDYDKQYDVILLNCPNLRSNKDAAILAGHTDATIVAVSEGLSRRQVLKVAMQPLVEHKLNLLGLIYNNRTFSMPKFIYNMV